MRNLKFRHIVLSTAVALLLALPAAAARRDKKEPEPEPLFPNATRVEPKAKPVQRLQKDLQKMYDASQEEGKEAEAEALALEMLSNARAGAYEKSIANQVLGFARLNADNYPEAITYLQAAIDAGGLNNDQHFQLMYNIAQMQLAEEMYDESLATMERFIAETQSQKSEHLALKGNALYRLERYQDAVPVLKAAMETATSQQSTLAQLLMACYFELEQPQEAAAIAESLLAKDPDNKSLVRNLASIYINADMADKAMQLMDGARQRGLLTEERDYQQLYQLYHFNEKEAEAIATIKEGLEKGVLKPAVEPYRVMAEAYYFSDKFEEAAQAYGQAATYATDGEPSLNQARMYAELERWSECKTAAQAAIAKGVKRTGEAWIIVGAAEFGLNNEAGAIAAYREAAKYPETKSSAESYLRQAGKL